jgi:hypothetical protein
MQVGDALPLSVQLAASATTKHVRAVVKNDAGAQIAGSPAVLAHVGLGQYTNYTLVMPNTKFVTVQYIIYDDSLFTVISASERAQSALFLKEASLVPPNLCTISGNVVDLGGVPAAGTRIVFRIAGVPKRTGDSLVVSDRITTYPGAEGSFSVNMVRGAVVLVEIDPAGIKNQFTVPDLPTASLLDLLPPIP